MKQISDDLRAAAVYQDGRVVVDIEAIDIDVVEPNKFWLDNVRLKPIDIKPYESLKILILDIETTGLDPAESRVISVGLKMGDKVKTWHLDDEFELVSGLMKILNTQKFDALIGHNIFKFDLPFIIYRADYHSIPHMFHIGQERNMTSATLNGMPIKFDYITHPNLEIVDTLHQICVWDKTAGKLTGYGLKKSVIELGLRAEQRLELTFEQIQESWNGDRKLLEEYLIEDLEDTQLLTDFLLPIVYYQMTRVPKMGLQEIAVASTAKKIQYVHGAFGYHSESIADDKVGYEGAISIAYQTGVLTNVSKVDVAGMYPWIMLNYGLCSRKDPRKQLLGWLNGLVEERMRLKELAKTGDKNAKMQQNALKVLVNSCYGFCGTGYYTYNDMQAAALITAIGREILKRMMETIAYHHGTVISVDTDGIYFSGVDASFVRLKMLENLPKGIGIDIELEDCGMFSYAAKNYIIVYSDGSTLVKGIFRKRNRCKLEKKWAIDYCIKYFTQSPAAADAFYQETLESIHNRTIDIDMLSITQKIAKNSKAFVELGLGQPGDKITTWFKEFKEPHKNNPYKMKKTQYIHTNTEEYSIEYYANMLTNVWNNINSPSIGDFEQ